MESASSYGVFRNFRVGIFATKKIITHNFNLLSAALYKYACEAVGGKLVKDIKIGSVLMCS